MRSRQTKQEVLHCFQNTICQGNSKLGLSQHCGVTTVVSSEYAPLGGSAVVTCSAGLLQSCEVETAQRPESTSSCLEDMT